MDSKSTSRLPRLGLWLGGFYVFLAAALFILTALTTKPGNVGLDWIPFVLLAMPLSLIDERFAIPGVLLNGVTLWCLGTVLQLFFRRVRRN